MKILCVIVLYNQKLDVSNSYNSFVKEALKDENLSLYVYDNSPYPQHLEDELSQQNIIYVSDTNNSGVSVAYNTAEKYASLNGFTWMLLLDQDTLFIDTNYLELCRLKIKKNPDVVLLAPKVITKQGSLMSPLRLKFRIPVFSDFIIPDNIYKISKIGIINSGILVNVEAFIKSGGYNNSVFLDYSDYQFIERFSKKYDNFYFVDFTLVQDFSNFENNVDKLQDRYALFCESLSGFEKNGFIDSINIFFIVFKRAVSLILRTKKITFIKVFITKFLVKK